MKYVNKDTTDEESIRLANMADEENKARKEEDDYFGFVVGTESMKYYCITLEEIADAVIETAGQIVTEDTDNE